MNSKTIVISMIVLGGIYMFVNSDNNKSGFAQEGEKPRPAIVTLMDTSGVLSEPAKAQSLKMMLLAQLKALGTKHKFAKAQLHIISSSFGRTVWVGTIADLKTQRAEDLIQKIEANAKHCNKLKQSFYAVKSAISKLENQGFNEIHFISFTSLIATPAPCSNTTSIALPQLPIEMDFESIFTSSTVLSSINYYYVSPHQLKPYMEAMEPLQAWAIGSDITFNMFDEEESAFHLSNRLVGVK